MKYFYFLLFSLFSVNAVADAILFFETTNPRLPDKVEIKDSRIRLSNQADPNIILFDRAAKKITFLNKDDKTYHQVTEKQLKKVLKKIKKLKLDPRLGLSLKQQAKLESVFKKQNLQFNPIIFNQNIQKMNSTTVKGIDCDIYAVAVSGKLHGTHCIASGRYLGINSADFKTYRYMMHFLQQAALGVQGIDPAMQNSFPGIPLVSYDGKGGLVRKFVSLHAENIERSLFIIPKDYKKLKQL